MLPAPIVDHLGVTSTPKPLWKPPKRFGATGTQTLGWKVELPYFAFPQIMAGLNPDDHRSLSMSSSQRSWREPASAFRFAARAKPVKHAWALTAGI